MVINLTVLALSIILTVSGCCGFWPTTAPKDFYKPIILMVTGFVGGIAIWWILLTIFGLVIKKDKEYEKPNWWSKFWLRQGITYINFLAGVHTKMTGKGYVPKSQRFLFVCNHRSKFDPMIACEHLGRYDLAFITKPSNFKIPMGGRFMRGLGYLPIERDDPLQSLEVMKKAIDRIEKNYTSIGVYPEGTRHLDGELGEFHEGVFSIALRSKVPVVVATISGTEKINKNACKRFTKVKFDIIAVLSYEEIQDKTAKALSDQVRQMMDEHLKEIEHTV